MPSMTDMIARRMISEGMQGRPQEAARQEQGQMPQEQAGPQMQQPQQQQVDPLLDNVAKQLATLEGSPAQKYQAFMQIIPQIVTAFVQRSQQQQQQT